MKKLTIKSLVLSLALVLTSTLAFSQGVENIIVEKYYKVSADDVAANADLTEGAIVYRVFVDLADGFELQAVYGDANHQLRIETDATFYNNTNAGSGLGESINSAFFGFFPSSGLDSWITIQGSSSNTLGVPKSEDSDGSLLTMFANNDAEIDLPLLTDQDGMVPGSPAGTTVAGLNTDAVGTVGGSSIISNNGAWSTTAGGVQGATSTNTVLIGQFTTTGSFELELNLQVRNTTTQAVENWVASSPVGAEITADFLTYPVPVTPILGCTDATACNYDATANTDDGSCIVPVPNCSECNATNDGLDIIDDDGDGICNADEIEGCTDATACNYDATATDDDGSCIIPVPNCMECNAAGDGLVMVDTDGDGICDENEVEGCMDPEACNYDATATDDDGSCLIPVPNCTECDGENLVIVDENSNGISDCEELNYIIASSENSCSVNDICMPVVTFEAPAGSPATDYTVADVIGYDIVMTYDTAKVTPTGVVDVSSDLIDPSFTSYTVNVDAANGTINISVYLNALAPVGTSFDGQGEVLCVGFNKTTDFDLVDTAEFDVTSIYESYLFGAAERNANGGSFISYLNSLMNGQLNFWNSNIPIANDETDPSKYLAVDILGCDQNTGAVHPDFMGYFVYDINNGSEVKIERDIAPTTNVMPVINSYDAYLMRKVLVNDASFTPNVYQMIAMDVNMDGIVSAGDVSQLNQRTVGTISEFMQAWNAAGTEDSKDWLFIAQNDLSAPEFSISTTYPANDGVGYSKWNVPVLDSCQSTPPQAGCTITDQTYIGILVGDADGGYKNIAADGVLKSTSSDHVVFNLGNATEENGYINIPVSLATAKALANGVDFTVEFDNSKLNFVAIEGAMDQNFVENVTNNEIRFSTGGNLEDAFASNEAIVILKFEKLTEQKITKADFVGATAVVDGQASGFEVMETVATISDVAVNVYPNPASDVVNVKVSADATVEVWNVNGQELIIESNVKADVVNEINVQGLANGVYLMKVVGNDFVEVKQVVINK